MKIQMIMGESDWSLPPIGEKGYITDQYGLCLTLELRKNSVEHKPKNGNENEDQMWFRGFPSSHGNFTIQSEVNNLFLTAEMYDAISILRVHGKGTDEIVS